MQELRAWASIPRFIITSRMRFWTAGYVAAWVTCDTIRDTLGGVRRPYR